MKYGELVPSKPEPAPILTWCVVVFALVVSSFTVWGVISALHSVHEVMSKIIH